MKFTPDGGMVKVQQKLKIDEESENARLLFLVEDTGMGISEDKIQDILKGEASSTSGTKGESGYGFGLPLVKHLIYKLNGTLDISSEVGKGTLFKIGLPFK
ncbi:sensor histidine kinase [Gracilimonas amylolytica]|uniref:sensor histidine kinase n=1 Tax=Gracilimonas amylolytica TaxID=1749045 RepID=UPI0022B7F84E|nr:ATP-binding protein [Gracilimonas amylolytica]